jgi:hypothetical protein
VSKGVKRIGLEVLGWSLVLVGLAAMVLPGPGLLCLFAGLVVLSQQYEWAERRLDPVERAALRAAYEGVSTAPRIAMSVAGGAVLVALGVLWMVAPDAPGWWPLRDSWWLFGGFWTGFSLVASGIISWALIVYSYRRFRVRGERPPARRG